MGSKPEGRSPKPLNLDRIQMIRHRISIIIAMIWTMCLFLPIESQADESLEEVKIPQALSAGLHHFLDLADPDKTVAFDPEKVAGYWISSTSQARMLRCIMQTAYSALLQPIMNLMFMKILRRSWHIRLIPISPISLPCLLRCGCSTGWTPGRTGNHRLLSGDTWIGLILRLLSKVFNIWKLHRTPIRAPTTRTTFTKPYFFLSIANATSW